MKYLLRIHNTNDSLENNDNNISDYSGFNHRQLTLSPKYNLSVHYSKAYKHIHFYSDSRYVCLFIGVLHYVKKHDKNCFESNIGNIAKGVIEEVEEHGSLAYSSLFGNYIVLVFDKKSSQLCLSNDHQSFFPTFYKIDSGQILITNECILVKQILNEKLSLNVESLVKFISPALLLEEVGVLSDVSFYHELKKMRPASILEIGISDKISSPKINNYWQPITKIDKSIDLHDASSQLRKCLDNVLLGLSKYEGSKNIYELSGGIDSACTYCYAKSNYHEMNSNSVAITMSGGTSTWSHEEKKVNSMINQYPSKHILFDADDYHNYLELSSHSGFVSSNQPSIFNLPYAATNILSLSEKEGGDFVIGGEGADWYLDGSHYIGDYLLSNLKFKSIFNLLKKARGGNFIQVFKYISRTFVAPLLPKPIEEKAYLKQFHETLLAFEMPNIFTRTVEMSLKKGMTETLFDITLRNSNLKYWAQKNEHDLMFPPNQNWHSIGNPGGVTRIFPFFDRQMIDFGLSVPPDVKYSLKADRISYYGSCKTMQREAFKSEIPTSVITDQYKSSYSNPVTNRVVDAYSTIFEKDLFVSRLGIVNRDKFHSYVIAFHEKVKGQEPYYDDEAWIDGLYSLELWLRHIKPFLG